jgi:hypothetical protein
MLRRAASVDIPTASMVRSEVLLGLIRQAILLCPDIGTAKTVGFDQASWCAEDDAGGALLRPKHDRGSPASLSFSRATPEHCPVPTIGSMLR